MSIAASAVGAAPVSDQPTATSTTQKPPRRRVILAKTDAVNAPEAR